jgi:hypothetical protein
MGATVQVAPLVIAPARIFLLLLCKSAGDVTTHLSEGQPCP